MTSHRDGPSPGTPCTAFAGHRRLAAGPLREVVLRVKHADDAAALIFDDHTGRVIDVDTRGTDDQVIARLVRAAPPQEHPDEGARPRGRPRLGVIAREVTLLPRHWEWLATQPGGASVTLRKLVEEARRHSGAADQARAAREAAYRFMTAMGGNLPGFEEALRALFAGDRVELEARLAKWPKGLRAYALELAYPAAE